MKMAFKSGITPWDWGIRIFSGGSYSHCEILFSDNTFFSSRPFSKVSFKRYDTIIPPYFGHWSFINIDISPKDEFIVRTWCELKVNSKYDWMGVARFLIPSLHASEDRWFCSEICISALQQVGFFKGIKAHEIHPTELYKICGQM